MPASLARIMDIQILTVFAFLVAASSFTAWSITLLSDYSPPNTLTNVAALQRIFGGSVWSVALSRTYLLSVTGELGWDWRAFTLSWGPDADCRFSHPAQPDRTKTHSNFVVVFMLL